MNDTGAIYISICVSVMILPLVYAFVKFFQVVGEDLDEWSKKQEKKPDEPFTRRDWVELAILIAVVALIVIGLINVFMVPPA